MLWIISYDAQFYAVILIILKAKFSFLQIWLMFFFCVNSTFYDYHHEAESFFRGNTSSAGKLIYHLKEIQHLSYKK